MPDQRDRWEVIEPEFDPETFEVQPGFDSLPELIETLLRIVAGSSEFHLASHYGLEPGAESLKGWLDKLRQENQLLVVAIVGEFNAGKSTLVNALLNREVAFTHHFQATMTLAFYYPGVDEDVRILYQNGAKEHMTIQKYLNQCRHPENIRQAQRVEVHIPSSLNFVLIDTPGMGSLDQELQGRAEEAVKEADAVVWVIDSNDVGGAQEGAFLRRAKEIGLPILVVLSKVDALSDQDIKNARGWLSRNLRYQEDEVIPISAQNHLQSHNDPGVSQLTQKLIQMSKDTQSVRAQSQDAKEREMVDEALGLVDLLQEKLNEDLRWIDRERKLMGSQAAAVESHLREFSRIAVTKHLRLHLVERVPESPQPDEVQAVLRHSLDAFNQRVPELCEQLMQEIRQETESVWRQQFQARQNDLQRKIQDLLSRSSEQERLVEYYQSELAQNAFREEIVHQTITAQRSSSVGEILAVVGGALAALYPNWLVRLLGGIAALIGMFITSPSMTNSQIMRRFQREQFINRLCQEFGEAVQQELSPSIHEYVEAIANEALESMCQKKWNGLTAQRIEAAKRAVDWLKQKLTAYRLGEGQ